MPIIKNSDLPTYDRLINEGRPILTSNKALHQDIRELHIGFLNLMPDAALEATERQWFRLISESNRVAQIHMHPFSLTIINREKSGKAYIDEYYDTFEQLKEIGLDALIITGANAETNAPITNKEHWKPLHNIIDWAYDNVTSTIVSCIATHALMVHYHDEKPFRHKQKKLGVFSYKITNRQHPLIKGMNTKFDIIQSHTNEIAKSQFQNSGMESLIEADDGSSYMATSKDGFRQICVQGHPEYDTVSLLKEYKRDVNWYKDGVIQTYPSFPENYFSLEIHQTLNDIKERILAGEEIDFPDEKIIPLIENTWADSARSVISSWIGHVYQTTNVNRQKQFMDGINPDNPLNM